ncbi:ATP-binding cassette domain-containing protein [Brenneria corticis]|uniref:Energy-coupling factor ABC transporter ATP-binding protein n=1 Tax=Brenneria corticis TaxID=2173106 RepID=A0A2U1U3V1_9GAMM|nr:ATP-binding cassette domain-containing protein [Brenneria sp. CFCC 11842]PWC16334.1 energy-coupling factor ABC transporter ATP-binding protein [Brenneria sp. CFCC 11842]
MIAVHNVTFCYHGAASPALSQVSLEIRPGEFIALLGRNGCGKSSLARLLNGIELPSQGQVVVDGRSTADNDAIPAIRRAVQIVFQNPENQQVGITVGEDIAFGLSNIGWPQRDIARRVAWAIQLTGLDAEQQRPVAQLSGGEKQKLALAAVLALAPRYLILDEATSMLDPAARRQFVATLHEVRKHTPFALIYITHHLDEVLDADRWILFNQGRQLADAPPAELQTQLELLHNCGLELPYYHHLAALLRQRGIPVSLTLNPQELMALL